MDVSSRLICGGAIKKSKFNANDMYLLLEKTINIMGIYPNLLHSDIGTEFNNTLLTAYTELKGIKTSFGKGFANNFIEAFNKSFKNNLKGLFSEDNPLEFFEENIIDYNSRAHGGSIKPHSPVMLYISLGDVENSEFQSLDSLKKLKNPKDLVKEAKVEITDRFVEKNITNPMLTLIKQLKPLLSPSDLSKGEYYILHVLSDMNKKSDKIINEQVIQNKVLEENFNTLKTQNDLLKSQMLVLVDEKKQEIRDRIKKSLLATKRKNRVRKEVLDMATIDTYEKAIKLVENFPGSERLKFSSILALACMYFFGMRISNTLTLKDDFFLGLLDIKVSEVNYVASKSNTIQCKQKPPEKVIDKYFNEAICWLIENRENYIAKDDNSKNYYLIDYERSYFNRHINKLLKELGNFRSHSFRIGLISRAYNKSKDLCLTRDLIGHASVKTTEHYIRLIDKKKNESKLSKALFDDLEEKRPEG